MVALFNCWLAARSWCSPGEVARGWALGMLLLFCGTAQGAEPAAKERQLKAAFIYNFTKFVGWPPGSFATPESPILIGVLGSDPLAAELENAVRNRKVNGRGIQVRRMQGVAGTRGLHLLFVGSSKDPLAGELQRSLRGASVLTVGETESFARAGGVVTFVIVEGKVRFDINTTAAKQASLKVSAQLQKLARTVR